MSAPSPSLVVACPKCGERLGVRAADVGKRGKCRRCGSVFRIAGKDSASRLTESAKPQADGGATGSHLDLSDLFEPPKPATVTFPCTLCETRITTATANVGKQVKCPDCGRVNTIPPPVAKPQAVVPAAMSGEQFDLWGVDEASNPADLAARSPTLHPVVCGLCQTLMYATDEQVGTKLKCPYCGTMTTAERRKPVKPRGPVTVPDGEEYQLDEASAPPPRPVYRPIESRDWREGEAGARTLDASGATHGEDVDSSERSRQAVSSRLPEREVVERPKMPRVPLVQGFWRMLLGSEVLVRWALLSLTLTVAGWFLSWVASAMGSMVFLAIPMFAIGCAFLGLWLLTALPLSLSIVTESSEGADRLYDPPSWISIDFAEAFFVAIAAAVSAIPAWLTLKATGTLPPETQEAIAVGAWMAFFPVVLLSNLEQSSAFAVLSPRLVSSLVRCPGPWLLFYVESAILAVVACVVIIGIAEGPSWLAYFGPWVTVTTLLVYMRLIGRLAWWLAESMPEAVEA